MSSAAGDAHRSEGTPLERMTGAIGITPGQPHGQSSNPEPNLRRPTEEEEWNRAVEKSRISAEAEAARRAQQEEQELAEALAASQGTNGQTLSDAERYAQEEKELREALEASNRESDDLQRALRDSMNLTEGPVASGSGTKSQSQSNYQISEIRTPLAVSTDLPPTSSVHHVPSPSPSRHSSVVSTSTSPSMSPNPARRSSRPLPRPPNGNLTQQLLSNSSPTSSSINQRVSSATSFAPPSLFNPFDDGASLYQTQPDATLSSSLSQPLFSGGTIPYHRPGSSQDQGRPEILHRDSESVSPRSSWALHSNTSLSTLEHSATRSSTDLGHDVDQQLLKDEEQVNAVYIGFPRLAPLASGTVCPQVIQVVEEAGLQTFSIEAKSYRTLITYLHWNADSSIITDRAATSIARASIAFEFYESDHHPPSVRFSLTVDALDDTNAAQLLPAPSHHAHEDRVAFRTEVPSYLELPITMMQLAKELQNIQSSARLCCDRGGGALYELGQAIQRVARAHGEKGPGSEEPAVETESWTRFSRFRRKLASKSPTDVSSGTASGGCPLSNNTSSHSTGMGQGARRKLAKLKAAASGGSGSNGSGSSGKMHKSKDQADDGATELRDEAFFVTPFLLPPPPTRASASI